MKKHSADLLVGMRAVFSSAYQEMESPYSVSNEHVEPLSVESLERTARVIAAIHKAREPLKFITPPPPEMKYASLSDAHWQSLVSDAIVHGTAMDFDEIAKKRDRAWAEQSKKTIEMHAARVFNESADYSTRAMKARQDFRRRMHTRQDDDMIAGLAYACQMISDCARMVSKTGAFKIDKIDLGDGIYVVRPPKPPVNKDAFFDHVKRFARENRISRNQRSADTGCVPVGREEYFRWLREDRLASAIERTQLPHEMTIHERIMPYRVKE